MKLSSVLVTSVTHTPSYLSGEETSECPLTEVELDRCCFCYQDILVLTASWLHLEALLCSREAPFFYLGAQGHHGEEPLVHSLAAEPSLGGSANITTNLDCTEATG